MRARARTHPDPAVLRVAVPSPLRCSFDYLPPKGVGAAVLHPGVRVKVPFGRTTRIGVVLEVEREPRVPAVTLKRIAEVIDEEPLLPRDALRLLIWSSNYFQHPVGEVVLGTLPRLLRAGRPLATYAEHILRLTPAGAGVDLDALARAPRQAALLARLREKPQGQHPRQLAQTGGAWRGALAALVKKGWVEACEPVIETRPAPGGGHRLNADQHTAVSAIEAAFGGFAVFALDGVTGSGKTEIYLALIEQLVATGQRALVLIPEIGLTQQLVERFRARLANGVVVLHSGLTDRERLSAWTTARDGRARVVMGTRSAVFVPLPRLGIVVVDEEHDLSFKQQDGFRYSARDLAVVRARQCGVPVVLGSATLLLETLNNVHKGRFTQLVLPQRAGPARPPRIEVIDVRARPFAAGLSDILVDAVRQHIDRHEQVLLFLNRRGYAPSLVCHACGWVADCARCDAHFVYHGEGARLRCHHCGSERSSDARCPECGGSDLRRLGYGTQRVADALASRLPGARVDRLDRDSTRAKGSLARVLARVHSGETDVLVGTQMLAKGHDFENVTLVGILDADGGLFGVDFRATERMAQLLVQVAGRAGRGTSPGRVLIQTHHPDHPMLQTLIRNGYRDFCAAALEERRAVGLPPITSMALVRAEAHQRAAAHAFLEEAQAAAHTAGAEHIRILGPAAAPMERRAGRYRAHLLLEAAVRSRLHLLLVRWVTMLGGLKSARRVRWSVDIDPLELT